MIVIFSRINYENIKYHQESINYADFYCARYSNKLDDLLLTNTLLNHISLQDTAIDHYMARKQFNINNVSNLKLNKINYNQEIDALTAIFEKVIVYTNNNIPFMAQVSDIKSMAVSLIEKMVNKNQLNKFLVYFRLNSPYIYDISENSYYIYQSEPQYSRNQVISNDFLKDIYIQYLLKSGQSSEFSLNVSGFSFEQLSTDVYINELAKLFKHLYLLIYGIEINNHKYFIKSIKFY